MHSVESYCIPNFDSASIFARILDKDKVPTLPRQHSQMPITSYQGGHFSITPTVPFTTKQSYLPNSNVRGRSSKHIMFSFSQLLPADSSNKVHSPLIHSEHPIHHFADSSMKKVSRPSLVRPTAPSLKSNPIDR